MRTFKTYLIVAVIGLSAGGAALAASPGEQAAMAITYGVLSDQNCGTHDGAAVMVDLNRGQKFSDEEKKRGMETVRAHLARAGTERFCIAVKSLFRETLGRDVK